MALTICSLVWKYVILTLAPRSAQFSQFLFVLHYCKWDYCWIKTIFYDPVNTQVLVWIPLHIETAIVDLSSQSQHISLLYSFAWKKWQAWWSTETTVPGKFLNSSCSPHQVCNILSASQVEMTSLTHYWHIDSSSDSRWIICLSWLALRSRHRCNLCTRLVIPHVANSLSTRT